MKRTGLAVVAALSISAFAAYSLAAQQQQRTDAGRGMHTGMMTESSQAMTQCPAMGNAMGMGMGMGNAMGMGGMMGNAMGMDMGMGNAMGMAMQRGGPASPAMLLHMAEPLGLTPEQILRLETLRDLPDETDKHMAPALAALQKADEALRAGTPSLGMYEEGLREAANHLVMMHTAMARAAVDAGTVLTPDQRSRLEIGMGMMRHMMGSGMMSGAGMEAMHGMRRTPDGTGSR